MYSPLFLSTFPEYTGEIRMKSKNVSFFSQAIVVRCTNTEGGDYDSSADNVLEISGDQSLN